MLKANASQSPSHRKNSSFSHLTTTANVVAGIKKIDWDFPILNNSNGIHSIHPYPAKFISEIPRHLIHELPIPPGTAVLDPFCGCGTTLVEAQNAGIPSIGIDLNPIACLISRVKTSPLPVGFIQAAKKCVSLASGMKTSVIPKIPNLDHWFSLQSQRSLSRITFAIQQFQDNPNLYDHLRVALSSIIVRVSNQESDTRYAAINKRVTAHGVLEVFYGACVKLQAAKSTIQVGRPPAIIIEQDILKVDTGLINLPIGLVITSPPYPNAYEYWLYHKYRMWWLGYDPLAVKEKEIGARAHYFRKKFPTVEDFIAQMRHVLELIQKVVVPGGFVCIVVGRSRIHGRNIDNARLITDIAESLDMRLTADVKRTIKTSRKSFNLSHARIKTESLLIFEQIHQLK